MDAVMQRGHYMNNEARWSIRPSHVLFGISAIFAIIFGILYLIWPIAPYHEDIIGLSYDALAEQHPDIAGLMTTLVDVVGLSFLAVGAFLAYTGEKAWKERWARAVITVVLFIFVIPMVVVVHLAGGPTGIMAVVTALVAAGLAAAYLSR